MIVKEFRFCLNAKEGELIMLRVELQERTTAKSLNLEMHGEFKGYCYFWDYLALQGEADRVAQIEVYYLPDRIVAAKFFTTTGAF